MALVAAPKPATTALTLSLSGGHRIDQGGYKLKAEFKNAPAGATIFLCADTAANSLDITGGHDLEKLLALFDTTGKWGQSIEVWAEAKHMGKTIATSAKTNLKIHIKPLPAQLTFAVMRAENLKYSGNPNGSGGGCTLTKTKYNNKWYFRSGSLLETDNNRRGFDCTTFPMSLWATYPDMSGAYGTKIVEALGAQRCGLEQLHWKEVVALFTELAGPLGPVAPPKKAQDPSFWRDPFAKPTRADLFDPRGTYLVWSAAHIVIYQDRTIHEFTHGGYKTTPAYLRDWSQAPQGLWWIRKLPSHLRA